MSKEVQSISEDVNGYLKLNYKINRILYSQKSPFQKVEIAETEGFGKMLFNDDIAMLSEKDEFIYHDMIVHVPLLTHFCPKKVLVIGGGDGGTVREVLKHRSVEEVVLVEIDECVVDACKKFIPQVSSALNDPRCRLIIDDGARFVIESKEKFDIVLVDSTDPIGPSMPLFNADFYAGVDRILSDEGIVVSQGESPYYYEEEQSSLIDIVSSIFNKTYLYRYSNLVYPGGMWCFIMGSKKAVPVNNTVLDRAKNKNFDTDYYTPLIHRESFVLPAFLEKKLINKIDNKDLFFM